MSEEEFEHSCNEQKPEFKVFSDTTEYPVLKKEGVDDGQIGETLFVKQEIDETDSSGRLIDETFSADGKDSSSERPETKEDSLVGKLKVRPFACLAEPTPAASNQPQANQYYGGAHYVPQAHQGFPLNLTSPHRYNLPPIYRKSENKSYVTNRSFTNPQEFLRNMGLQYLLNNNNFPDRGSCKNSPTIHNKLPLTMQYLDHREIVPNMFLRNPTADQMPNSYIPLKIPSVHPRSFIPPHSSVPLVISAQDTNVPSSSDLHVSSEIANPSLEDACTTSVTKNVPVKEEERNEEFTNIHSTPTTTNVIVKDEVDLGVSAGGYGEYLNDFGNHFLTSDSTAPQVPTTSSKINMVATTELDADKRESSEGSDPIDFHFIPKELQSRYRDVDPDDLLPAFKPNGRLLCCVCDYRQNTEKAMTKHKERLHSAKYNYRCFLCNRPDTFIFPNWNLLEHHVATVHRGEKRFKCMRCQSCFKTKSGLKNHHANVCRVADPYACHLCSYTCRSMGMLGNHLSKIHDDTPQECSICWKRVKKSDMKKHLYTHNKNTTTKKCDICDFATPSKAKMLSHYNRTFHNRKFRCELCGWGTNVDELFEKHRNTCTKDRSRQLYVCPIPGCDKKFKNHMNYTHHSRIHKLPESRVFQCPDKDCEYTVMIHATLVKHLKLTKHHFPFKCPECTLRFKKEDSMAAHVQKTHIEKIIQKFGYPLPVEDDDSNVAADQNDMEEDEEDPYAHFKKGWLGISCFDEEEDTINQTSNALNAASSSFSIETHGKPTNDTPEFTHVIPEVSCRVECSHETRDTTNQTHSTTNQTHSITKLEQGDGRTDQLPETPITSNFEGMSASTTQVDFIIKTDLPNDTVKVECGDAMTVTPSVDFAQNQITLHSPCESDISNIRVEDVTVKTEPDTSENSIVIPSVSCPGFPNTNLDVSDQSDCIKSDPDEDLVDTNSESMVITPSIDFLRFEL
uniref:Zinc finger protein 549 n=2 Tax=Lygus hesperus TaxID=30085 RepID=A0A146L2I6_LYGHE